MSLLESLQDLILISTDRKSIRQNTRKGDRVDDRNTGSMLRRCTLTTQMFILTAVAGLLVWGTMDLYQSHVLEDIFRSKLAERFSNEAENQRIRFDRYIKAHHQAVKLFISSSRLKFHVAQNDWLVKKTVKVYRRPPPWLPPLSVIRNFVQPRYLLLLDNSGQLREIYQSTEKPPPDILMHPDRMLLNLSHNQGFLTQINNTPYLIASANITDNKKRPAGIMMLATPLDEAFLIASQGSILDEAHVIALLAENQPAILVSSNTSRVVPGTRIDELEARYLATGQGFFDYGATDTLIELVSFVSTEEVRQLTEEVLTEDRRILGFTAVAFVSVFVLITWLLTRRITGLTARVVTFSKGINIKHPTHERGDELAILEDNFHRLVEAVYKETAALEYQAMHDSLTELPNRKLIHNRLQQELLRMEDNGKPLVLIVSDLNHFKEINDTLGHHIGDLILQQSAVRLYEVFRKSDSVARLGGDEFGILLPETNLDQAIHLVVRVVQQFNQPFIIEGQTLSVGISMGLVECPAHGDDINLLMQHADVAMYVAKRSHCGYSVYEPDEDTHNVGKLALMSEFQEAIVKHRLELSYQPKINIINNTVIGVEALLRWNHPQRGYIDPEEFIPLAEQTGLIKALTDWVLEEAIHQCAIWNKEGLNLSVAINLSVHNLHDITLLEKIRKLISEKEFPAPLITLELTESDIMTDPKRARKTLQQMSDMGIRLSIDDFGTGYSSLSYLKQLPVDEIKIDRSFVMEMNEDEDDAAIVRATIDLAHNMGLSVVAEGVQDHETLESLKVLDCDVAQGFYISKPLKTEGFVDWIKHYNKTQG
ncbi:diguanylate cyclase/phosphodiesterase (GGDEF & EAL domains) with PAS/PAC sensor(s) [hydrothermal vent metagenome]|uniref:Diguanylate cyclase/phosphodiesterase (GGDEF & EAL domains) with PAS/PAC sensor(S) n=1 Tax=hydrothermal vent metagenome TaxID=652676 RepID=A0A3B0XV76_9ZZZZ